jgi:hypothetical protein
MIVLLIRKGDVGWGYRKAGRLPIGFEVCAAQQRGVRSNVLEHSCIPSTAKAWCFGLSQVSAL